ncbi:hypothetical protein CAPTEDRAFT_117083 [Capitella teleta]|uniref:Cytochrome P450 n=1 Tax=Capitella teleta TaxID=283909 RepID=R7ULY9_CAPTE|nr:hypothetical protein CAPTEDRAFT_117083 [Capitella teleta]|eukprot:ELU04297.1 hypothetical protein CAPTEDRAFT_117083 [Capitella teleta]
MFLILLGTFVLLLAVHFILKDLIIYQRYGHIPGPKGLPFIGNLHQINRLQPWISISDWGKEYGPLMKVNFLGQVVIICNTFESVRDMLDTKGKDFGGRERGYRSAIITKSSGLMRMDVQDPEWRLSRRLLHSSVKAFGPGLSRIEHYAQQMSEDFVETFKKCNGEPINPLSTIYTTTLGMISLMIYGRKLDPTNSEIFHSIKTVTDLGNESFHVGKDGMQLERFPWMRFFGNHTYKIIKIAQSHVAKIEAWYRNEIVPLEDAELDDSLGKPYMKVLRDYNSKAPPEERISNKTMTGNGIHVTFAGVLTTTTTLYHLILVFLHNPNTQKKMIKEIDEVLGTRVPSLSDRNRMPYVNAVLNEIMRYGSVGPLGITHRAVVDTDILGTKIPKDSHVMPNLYLVHYDKKVFGDPEVFRPERYLDENGDSLQAEHEVWKHTIPFGMGPRICAGMMFAQFRLFLWVCILYQRFDIVADPNHPLPPCDIMNTELNGLSLMSKPYKARFISKV